MAAGGKRGGIDGAVVDGEVEEVLVVLHVGALDGGGALVPAAVVLLLVVVLEVGEVAGDAPRRGGVEVGRREGVEAERGGVLVDVLDDGLQRGEVLDVVNAVAGGLDELGVGDDAVALEAVADGDELAAGVIQVVVLGVEQLGDGAVLEVHRVVAPLLDAILVADDEEGRSRGLVHLGGQGLLIGARGGRDDLDLDVGVGGHVVAGKLLQRLVKLGLEVEPVDGALAIGARCAAARGAAGVGAAARAAGETSDGGEACPADERPACDALPKHMTSS